MPLGDVWPRSLPVNWATMFYRTTINFCFQFHTGIKYGTKFIHTIIWCPEKSRNESINNQKTHPVSGNKSTSISYNNTEKKTENVVESIINDYYWGKLIEKLIKSNIKMSLLQMNTWAEQTRRVETGIDQMQSISWYLNVTDSALQRVCNVLASFWFDYFSQCKLFFLLSSPKQRSVSLFIFRNKLFI